jgi:class 3 adenylate cyclase
VSVLRDGLRPTLPEGDAAGPPEYVELMTNCWNTDPTVRPSFLEVMTRLSSMAGDATGLSTSFTSTSSKGGGHSSVFGSWSPSTTHSNSLGTTSNSRSSDSSSADADAAAAAALEVRPPEGELTIVFTDISRAASLWEFDPMAMRDATVLHNAALRGLLKRHRGYEVVFIRDRNSGEGSFCMAFQHAADALAWCLDVQQALMQVDWPDRLLAHPGAAEEWAENGAEGGGVMLYRGLRVRMGVHSGTTRMIRDPMSRRIEYIGPTVHTAARITALAHGGQILVSHATHRQVITSHEDSTHHNIACLGTFEMPDSPQGKRAITRHTMSRCCCVSLRFRLLGAKLYELKAEGLEGRFFGGVTKGEGETEPSDPGEGGGEMQTTVGDGMAFKEDNFLTSANLCRWIIDYNEVQVGQQIGLGSYGVVYKGKWKGVDVAVKRFIKQKLDERRMLEFRAEMAFLSELHHPNIVLFIGNRPHTRTTAHTHTHTQRERERGPHTHTRTLTDRACRTQARASRNPICASSRSS